MSRTATPTFILELPLRTGRMQVNALDKRFDALHFPYNVTLQEMLRRLTSMRADARYAAARRMPKATLEARKARAAAFTALRREFAFTEYAAHDVASEHVRASGWIGELVDSHTVQTLASRAFDACHQYALGVRGRPRFKRRGQIASIEGKGATSPLNWADDHVVWGGKRRDRRMVLRPLFDAKDKQCVQAHALNHRVKYVRLIRRTIGGRTRYFAQLACEGRALQRYAAKDADVCIDLGPSTAAIVSRDNAALVSFLPEISEDLAQKRRLQRALDRSRRATNPQCFNADGTFKRGQRLTEFSSRYKIMRALLSEQERQMAERRSRAHGRLSNIVMRDFGCRVSSERLSKRAWQKRWGRRMKATAPATFMSNIRFKAESAGGGLKEFNPATFRLSQFDHTTGDCLKKPLSLRQHVLRDGSGQEVQRDLYSAWLGLFVDHQADELDVLRAQSAWEAAYPLLRAASSVVKAASWTPRGLARVPERGRAVRTQQQPEYRPRVPASPAGKEANVTL
ncbi:MAG: hypothetical protein PHO55_11185 [Thiomonas arsenitoxydans]|nr:hypothetical protein [Thiomonas arsenitoxydans]